MSFVNAGFSPHMSVFSPHMSVINPQGIENKREFRPELKELIEQDRRYAFFDEILMRFWCLWRDHSLISSPVHAVNGVLLGSIQEGLAYGLD